MSSSPHPQNAEGSNLNGLNPFDSQKWFTCNFSLQYSSTIQQTGIESTQMYQVEVVILIEHQILATNSEVGVAAGGEN